MFLASGQVETTERCAWQKRTSLTLASVTSINDGFKLPASYLHRLLSDASYERLAKGDADAPTTVRSPEHEGSSLAGQGNLLFGPVLSGINIDSAGQTYTWHTYNIILPKELRARHGAVDGCGNCESGNVNGGLAGLQIGEIQPATTYFRSRPVLTFIWRLSPEMQE
eukprot:4999498-Pleurochrysis_carterae.AAC.14